MGCSRSAAGPFSEIKMRFIRPPAWLAFTFAAFAAAASAQSDKAPGTGTYRSALEGYKRYADEPLVPWREANDTVGRIGGWQAYAREAQGAATPAAPASSPATAAPAQHHGSHKSP
jgi:hypothetical protein